MTNNPTPVNTTAYPKMKALYFGTPCFVWKVLKRNESHLCYINIGTSGWDEEIIKVSIANLVPISC